MHVVNDTRVASDPGAHGPPSVELYLSEPLRGMAQLAALPLAFGWLRRAPRGDGHGVLVLPGLMATDLPTAPLRFFVGSLGYDVSGWGLERNLGPTAEVLDALPRTLEQLADRTTGPVSLVGWSLGGIFAREMARRRPDLVRQVITLGSPFALVDRRQSRADGAYRRQARHHAGTEEAPTPEDLAKPLPVPSTAVYSRRDGIVDWQACTQPSGPNRESVEVRCAHLGFGVDAATLWLVADRLSLPADGWQRFRPTPPRRALYGTVTDHQRGV